MKNLKLTCTMYVLFFIVILPFGLSTAQTYNISGYFWDVLSQEGRDLEGRVVQLLDDNDNVVKETHLDEDGYYDFSTNAVDDEKANIPDNFRMLDPYPNPFNPHTNLLFELDEPETVQINIYRADSGQLVEKTGPERIGPGRYTIPWNPRSELASGVYIARIIAGREMETRKITLLKGSAHNGRGLGRISSIAGYKRPPKEDEIGAMSKALNGTYKIRFSDGDYYTYTSDELDYTGARIEHNKPQIKRVSEHSDAYPSWLEGFRALTATDGSGIYENTEVRHTYAPIELYGVTDNIPDDWLEYVRKAIGDYNNEEGEGWEEMTGLNLFVEKDGEMGGVEEGKTKVQIRYVHAHEMSYPNRTGEMLWENETADDNRIPRRGILNLNKDVIGISDIDEVYAVAAHELGRALALQRSLDLNHIMTESIRPYHKITEEEALIAKTYHLLPNLTDMKNYTE